MRQTLIAFLLAVMPALAVTADDGHRLWLRAELPADVTTRIDKTMADDDGYRISGHHIEARSERGLLYGRYALMRGEQGESHPAFKYRILNHWDNPDGTVERGFAGRSIFWSTEGKVGSATFADDMKLYGEALASIGINGTVLNNVNAKPEALSEKQLLTAKAIADLLRPYGVRVYLSINFASPMKLGGLETADPLNAGVKRWWKAKVKDIYRLIPDFGGFLVKANSEGEPGPQDFGRSHADGANMLGEALRPYKGIVMWRAFVYSPQSNDRASQAYEEFMPLDGLFADNVIVQIKNGPVDFQPREPYSPLFTAMKKTPMMVEFQVTQEYLGAANHLVFLAPMWKEFFSQVKAQSLKAMAGVANIGDDANWCGHHFAQANWYAFGRLAWDPELSSRQIAEEWLKQTFGLTPSAEPVWGSLVQAMLLSHEACVSYMMPLGIHHIFAGGHHYGPEPWYQPKGVRADWTPPYYHRADSTGLGFDRTMQGTANVSQYPDSLCKRYNDIATCPEQLLAWFHHVPWDHRMKSGRTFWDELCHKYADGVSQARRFLTVWDTARPYVDRQRFEEVQRKLRIQARDAEWWRDACLLYFQTFSHRPIPQDMEHPVHNLDEMMQFHIPITMYENPECGYTK